MIALRAGVRGVCAYLVCLMLLPLLLTACASDMWRQALSEKPRVDSLDPLSLPAKAIGQGGEGDDQGADVISTQGRSELIPTALEDSDPLPKFTVPWLSFVNTPLQDVLQAVVADARVALAIVWDNPASKISRSSISMTNLTGDLTDVLNKLADSYGFYWRYKDGMLHIAADRQYIASIPPIADLFESLPIMVKTLGGTDVFLDKSARMITFRANSQAYSKIKSYLDVMRKNRSLIVYDTYIWEVILNDASKMGIDWGAMPGNVAATSITSGAGSALSNATNTFTAGLVNAASGGTGLALSFAGSRLSMNVLIDFLRSQGTINSLSQPKIQLLSGGKAVLKDEIATTYVSRVGTSSISAGTVIPGSVETSQVKTGVVLEVTGDVSDGTIYSDIALRVSDLMGMGMATVSGSTIALPKTSSREVHTHVRAKPGDTILLAGIQYDKLSGAENTGMGIVRSNQTDLLRSELIIVMRPRIKHFVHQGDEEKVQAKPLAATRQLPALTEKAVSSPPAKLITQPISLPVKPQPALEVEKKSLPLPPLEVKKTPLPLPLPVLESEKPLLPLLALEVAKPTLPPPAQELEKPLPPLPVLEVAKTTLPPPAQEVAKIPAHKPLAARASNAAVIEAKAPDAETMTDTKAQAPDMDATSGIFLQLGAFRTSSNAESFRYELENQIGWRRDPGQSMRVLAPAQASEGALYRVLVGPFANRQVAGKWADRAQKIVGSRPILVMR